MSKNQKHGFIIGSQNGTNVNIAGDGGDIVVSGDSGDAVVFSGKRKGGVVVTGSIDTGGARVIVQSDGPVHHGSGTQVNVRSKKK